MKKLLLLSILFTMISCSEKKDKTEFGKEALEAKMTAVDGNELAFKDILEKYKGNVVVIDVWASWCPDCKAGMPKLHALQEQFPNVKYLFLSYDRETDAWKKGIETFGTKGDNYHVGANMKKGAFAEDIKLDWIPRYMVVNKEGNIVLFRAIEADDENLINTLNTLK
ncbi:TlpA family protein disulfide reductase [Flavobacterium rhizosphaerae]|uniref:TlpA disulfide reductase family protein n=1 Tax=Flavobacterium rhizosphaerae TaxID=3163298 RepID=A0ABW8YWH1_9FLAO